MLSHEVCILFDTGPFCVLTLTDFVMGRNSLHNGEKPRKRRKVESEISATIRAIADQNSKLTDNIKQLLAENSAKDRLIRELRRDVLQCKEIMERHNIEMDVSLIGRLEDHAPEIFASHLPKSGKPPAALLTPKSSGVDQDPASCWGMGLPSSSFQDDETHVEHSSSSLDNMGACFDSFCTRSLDLEHQFLESTAWETSTPELNEQ